ncbi:uncharacterized protein LOC135170096 [Diachasmimorpha longicaudata]|uniref:uncharacterized protein LOC135170096 n=1 Tax=Diachasmimorpha longicaudata TaxID=58733 RepID=UPI0030B8A3C2
MQTIQAITIIAFLAIISTGVLCYDPLSFLTVLKIGCRPCGDDCGLCEYGSAFSTICEAKECKRGPDEHCGIQGSCGAGMHCLCDRCYGCSTDNFKCSTFMPTCIPQEDHLRNFATGHQLASF